MSKLGLNGLFFFFLPIIPIILEQNNNAFVHAIVSALQVHILEPTRPMPTSSRESGLLSAQGNVATVLSTTAVNCLHQLILIHQLK